MLALKSCFSSVHQAKKDAENPERAQKRAKEKLTLAEARLAAAQDRYRQTNAEADKIALDQATTAARLARGATEKEGLREKRLCIELMRS